MKQTDSSERPATHQALKPPSALLLAMEGRAMLEWASFALAWPLLPAAVRLLNEMASFESAGVSGRA